MKNLLCVVLAAFLLTMSVLPGLTVQAASPDTFSGTRVVEFVFDTSDLDNYANGGRAGVDLYLRKNAPQWLNHSLQADGRDVFLTYSFTFSSFDEYIQRITALLGYQPAIMYTPDKILVEEFEPVELLGSLIQGLGNSEQLKKRAKAIKNEIAFAELSHDFEDQKIAICPDEMQWQIPVRTLEIETLWEGSTLKRTVRWTISTEHIKHSQWKDLVSVCKDIGQVSEETSDSEVVFCVTFSSVSEQEMVNKTGLCLGVPSGLGVQFVEATEESCRYLWTESYLLDHYLEESGVFTYRYQCSEQMLNPAVENDGMEIGVVGVSGENDTYREVTQIVANNQYDIKFSYNAPFRFQTIQVNTNCSSVFKRIQRTITLTAPTNAAEVYHETIKAQLSKKLPKGTVLQMYDQDEVRYYVLTYSAWLWKDIEKFTDKFLPVKISCSDSWVPFGKSAYKETVDSTNVLDGFDSAISVRMEYLFPGKGEAQVVTDVGQQIKLSYQHLHYIKLILEVLVLAIVVVIILLLVKTIKKCVKNRKAKTTEPEQIAQEVQLQPETETEPNDQDP